MTRDEFSTIRQELRELLPGEVRKHPGHHGAIQIEIRGDKFPTTILAIDSVLSVYADNATEEPAGLLLRGGKSIRVIPYSEIRSVRLLVFIPYGH